MSGESNCPPDDQGMELGENVRIARRLEVEQRVSAGVKQYFSDNQGRQQIAGASGPSVAAVEAAKAFLTGLGYNKVRAEVGACMLQMPIRPCVVTWCRAEMQGEGEDAKEVVTQLGDQISFFINC